MPRILATRLPILASGILFGYAYSLPAQSSSPLLHPDDAALNRQAPSLFNVRLETSKGPILIQVHRDWSPHGADRFFNLVSAGYYDQVRFSRVIKDKWVQFGINGDPVISTIWRTNTIPDDPRVESNVRGTVAFAFAVTNGRTTQVFINLRDNSATHDAEPFVPFGRVIEGMDVADSLNSAYGENAGGGIRAGHQGPLFEGGNAYLQQNFPQLDFIKHATIDTSINQFEKGDFRVTYDSRGITGLANPRDPFGAQMLAPNQHLALVVRFRDGGTNWQDLADSPPQLSSSTRNSGVTFANSAANSPLKVIQTYSTEGNSLDWDISLAAATNEPVEIGDLAISIPVSGPRGENPQQIFEHGFLKHQFISGNGSFLYFVRASGVPPFLLVTVRPSTKLEYSSGGAAGGRGGALVYVHSGLSGGRETRGTWRQEHTFLHLGPAGSTNSSTHYGFRFQWAKSYDDLRELIYKAGLFDIRSVPGMVIPNDLSARFSLHTSAHIDSIDAEFPQQTEITKLTAPSPDFHLYQAAFHRLGENRLTIHHDGDRTTFLEYFVTEPLETLIKKRSSFIANHQQIRDPSKWWDGVFGPYDMKNKVLRTIDDPDIFTGRMIYVLTCDDPGLCKAPFLAEKNVSFPDRKEIEAIEYYLEHFVWGKLQRTDKETPYPYGVYGTPNWYVDRDAARRKALAESTANATAKRDLNKEHVWRSYDYPHMVMMYFHMYQIAKLYPKLSAYLDAPGYLERAYQTARAFFIYPYEIYPEYYETRKWGLYNELVVLKLADALDAEGFPDRAKWIRDEWERKVKYFVYDDQYPFRSEYAFDRTAFESSYALAKYGATVEMKPDTNLWHDVKLDKWYSHPVVRKEDSRAFMDRQLLAGMCVRGWLEASYYQLGSDPGLSYMAAMGGWGILDYALNFAPKPFDWLQLGYASYLSSWCLMNTGPPESNYGFWFPGKENDGAAGWQFMSSKVGRAWMGADVPRGPWHYDGEIDLGFGGALRMAATIVTKDPLFDWIAYGGTLIINGDKLSIIPRDGLRQRFDVVLPDPDQPATANHRMKIELDRDGFASGEPILMDKSLKRLSFKVENRTGDSHQTILHLNLPSATNYTLHQDDKLVPLEPSPGFDYPQRAQINLKNGPTNLELRRSE
jgi:cyclophilin family peptidyl-prolyl cis-trans isomerase